MGLNREEIYGTITLERAYQVKKWGTEKDKDLSISDWLLILERELEKAKTHRLEEMVESNASELPNANCKSRILKIATVCVAALENLE